MFYAAVYFYLKKTLLTILICFLDATSTGYILKNYDDLILAKKRCLFFANRDQGSKLKVFVRKKRKNNR